MKKVLCFAAAAMAIFASCQKTEVVYNNDGPQEIGIFAVNKVATKAPVTGTVFNTSDNMRVSAYLAEVDGGTPGSYFEDILFSYYQNGQTWVGGQYWPLSNATLNFIAVTEIGGGVDVDLPATSTTTAEDNITFSFTEANNTTSAKGAFEVTLDKNVAYNQSDVMYASVQAKKAATVAGKAGLEFKHALSWINFAFNTNVETQNVVKINSVTLNARYNGVLTVTDNAYSTTDADRAVSAAWNAVNVNEDLVNLKVPNDACTDEAGVLELQKATSATYYGKGLLVVPTNGVRTDYENYFVINYSIFQKNSAGNQTEIVYDYKHVLNGDWEMGKKYTYTIQVNMHEIEVNPSVDAWDEPDATPIPLG